MSRGRIVLAACAVAAVAAAGVLAGPPPESVRLGYEAGDDWEPAIAADRRGHVYALWSHYGDEPSPRAELQVSADSGRTWAGPGPIVPSDVRMDDPQIAVDPADGETVFAAFMRGDKSSQFVARSDDSGASWTLVLVEPLERGTDKDILAVRGDDVYLAYNAVQKIYVSASHDGGATWTLHKVVSNTNSKLGWSLPSGGAVDSRGTAYFAWAGYEGNGKPSGDVNLFVTRSTDRGATWTTSAVDVSGAPPPCGCGGWAYWGAQIALAVDDRDRVYVLYNAGPSKFARSRMFFARSDDRGVTWSARQDVSLAPAGANHLFPAVAARGDGDVRIAWLDDRNGFDEGSDDPDARWNVYYRSSSDGGSTWSAEEQLSGFVPGYSYKLAEGFLEPYGDYMELDIDGAGRTHAIWGEGPSYAGPGNVWYTRR